MKLWTLGPAGTFSHEAALTLFPGADIEFCANFDALFDVLKKSPERIGIAPIENSIYGSVDEVLDLLRETGVKLWKTRDISIKHAFGATDPQKVKNVASHPQALRQCRHWLHEHYPKAEHLAVSSTSSAVELAKKDPTVGAIASVKALKKAGLTVVSEDIEANGNTTRFGIVSLTDPFPGAKRTQMGIVIHPTADHPGLLHKILTPFKVYDVNLTRIESRPSGRKMWDYIFFLDFLGTSQDPRTQKVLSELKELAEITVLGEW